jgi:hypothetical protein
MRDQVTIRHRVGVALDGIHHGVSSLRAMLAPGTYVASPWLRFGAAFVVGYRLGRDQTVVHPARARDALVRVLLRTALRNVARSAVDDVTRRAN